ncbi:gamma-interferon-inducible lysosomal thiol reductase [Canna indica]|uniref:Gamma-interferon-inducible lysosomal thiol reductase n=1 Tax=Canna indica TaxID=4628 RepID=A0AAQ3QM09_9LILI|nr:gamma-interferon-inducible lysosomal thiol reductase [Canna indica]
MNHLVPARHKPIRPSLVIHRSSRHSSNLVPSSAMAAPARFVVFLVVCFIASSSVVSASDSPPKIPLALYYETLCPYCSKFIVNQLPNIFRDGLISIVDLELVPYGNAFLDSNNTISCQHGPDECLLNTVEACAISAWPDLEKHFGFILCVESLILENKHLEWESCFSKLGIDSHAVKECYDSGHGKELELQYAAKTGSLRPPHKYVPWVVVNGAPLFEDYMNFESYICRAYSGEPPEACSKLPLKKDQDMKADHSHVLHADGMVSSSATNNNQKKIKMVI